MSTAGRGRTALVAVAVAVVAVAAAALVLHAWYEQRPPVLDASGPGPVLRLTRETGDVPPPRFGVPLGDGATVTLALVDVTTEDGRPAGVVLVVPPGGSSSELTLAQGESGVAGGVRVTAVRVWRMPDPANDAVDVRVASAS